MITDQLLSYIQTRMQQGASRSEISQALSSQGWQFDDIEKAFSMVVVPPSAVSPIAQPMVDPTSQQTSASPVQSTDPAVASPVSLETTNPVSPSFSPVQSYPTAATQTAAPVKKKMGTGVKLLLGCLVVLILGGICTGVAVVLGLVELGKVGQQIEESEANDPEKWASAGKVGEAVVVEGIQWTVLEARDIGATIPAESETLSDCVSTNGKYIYVQVKVKNTTDQAQSSSFAIQYLYDSNKNEYQDSISIFQCMDNMDDVWLTENLEPGLELTRRLYYDVPTDASGFKIKVTDLTVWGINYAYIDLGI